MAEKEHIEREAAILALLDKGQRSKRYHLGDVWELIFDEIKEAIASIPAAAVRPVVLCRDCKFAPIGDNDGSDLEWPFNEFDENPCPYKCSDNWYSHKPAPDFYCAAGEKRNEFEETDNELPRL